MNRALNELKTANLQSEKDVNHIKQNSLLAEFAGGKIANVNHFLAKLGKIARQFSLKKCRRVILRSEIAKCVNEQE